MALTPSQQALEQISRAARILVITRELPTIDAIASAIAMGLFLKKMGKSADVVVPGFDERTVPAFLTKLNGIVPRLGSLRALEISLDVSKTPIDEFLYDVRDGKLEITVVPKEREWSVNDLAFRHGKDRYDLVIALDAPDMASLGAPAREHADFFHRTTVINIDHAGTNEHWGQANIVDLNAVSTTEVLHGLMEEWNRALIDETVATALLAGMIAKTRSFRTANVTPRTLALSGQLIAMGAKREEIVNGLWRTRSVSTLKLWGRALARLKHEPDTGIVWTVLSHKDFLESESGAEALDDVFDELIAFAPEAKIGVLISEDERDRDAVNVTIATTAPYSAADVGRPLGASGTRDRAKVTLRNTTLVDAAKSTIDLLKKTISK
jgi:nanoRNase/pAp phosphatase (c-di-AMP/oligoRNAs hydrolase)